MNVVSFDSREAFLAATRARPVRGARREAGPWEGSVPGGPLDPVGPAGAGWFYKPVLPATGLTVRPNVVGEVVTPWLFARLGLPHLPAKPIWLAAPSRWVVGMPRIELEGDRATHVRTSELPLRRLASLHDLGLWKLFVADLLVGNGDRHPGNLLAAPTGFLPIDHGLSLLRPTLVLPRCDYFHFVPEYRNVSGFGGLDADRGAASSYRCRLDAQLGTPEAVARANPLYGEILRRLEEDDVLRCEAARFIARARQVLTRRIFARLTDELPAELFEADGSAGGRYLRETMAARLAGIDRALGLV